MGIPTIHFARWVLIDNNKHMMFFSNFDLSWESYLDDFIEKAHGGLTLAWGSGVGFPATRYHSLLVERSSFPAALEITAETAEGEIMGLRHRTQPIWGVQFHPESIATAGGMRILQNFLELN